MVDQVIKCARALYPGMVTLQSDVLPRGEARREDEARWAQQEAPEDDAEIGGGHGWDMIAGGIGRDRLLPDHDPDAPWNDGKSIAQTGSARLPYDMASLDALPSDHEIGGLMSGRFADGVTYAPLPVPGDGQPAKRGVFGPNGNTYSDGSYAPNGGTRGRDKETGKIIRHMGVDLPAKIGTSVTAVDDGVVTSVGTQWSKKNPKKKTGWGDYVDIRYHDSQIGKSAHLKPEGRPVVGAHVRRGETIGIVGNTGNARTKGDHLHYEERLPNGQTIEPTASVRRRRVYIYPPD